MEPARERDFPERPTEVLHPNVATSAAIFSALSAQELPGPNAADSPDSSLVTCGECAISEERPCNILGPQETVTFGVAQMEDAGDVVSAEGSLVMKRGDEWFSDGAAQFSGEECFVGKAEHDVLEDDDDTDDSSELDDVLFGSNALLRERIEKAAEMGSETAARWLKRRHRRKQRQKEHRLFKPSCEKKRRRTKRTAATVSKVPAKVEDVLRRANHAYLERNIPEAVSLLEEAIKEAPGVHDPFHLLGLLYEEELNEPGKALDCYMLAAHLVPDDYHLWTRVATMSREQGHIRQAVYAYQKALRSAKAAEAPVDEAAVYDLSVCFLLEGNYSKAMERLAFLYSRHPGNVLLGYELAQCYRKLNQIDNAIRALYSCIILPSVHDAMDASNNDILLSVDSCEKGQGRVAYDRRSVLVLTELLTLAKRFDECERLLLHVVNLDLIEQNNCPLELVVRLAASQLYLNHVHTPYPNKAFELLSGLPKTLTKDQVQCVDLYLLLIDAFYAASFPDKALALFTQIARLPQVRKNASIWVKIARCQLQLSKQRRSSDAASEVTKCMLEHDAVVGTSVDRNRKGDTHARLLLSQVLTEVGRSSGAGNALFSFMTAAAVVADGDAATGRSLAEGIPEAFSHCERLQRLQALQEQLPHVLQIAAKPQELLSEEETTERRVWIDAFLVLVQNSELDAQRVLRHNVKRRLGGLELDCDAQEKLLDELGVVESNTGEPDTQMETSMVDQNETAMGVNSRDPLFALVSTGTADNRVSDFHPSGNGFQTPETAVVADNDAVVLRAQRPETAERLSMAGDGEGVLFGALSEGKKNLVVSSHSSSSAAIPYVKVKRDLGLVPLEDILGWRDYGFFLETAVGVVMRSAKLYRSAVELLEAILANKRAVKAQQFEAERRRFLLQLKRLSLQLSIEGGLYRIALAYIREHYLKRPESSNRCLQAFGRLLFCGTLARATLGGIPSSLEKEALLEARAWCIRQLLQRPNHYILTLLAGHFCNLSGRWRLAVAEYARAHRLVPRDDLTSLALATALLNFGVSRIAQDRHGALLRGFAMLSTYARQRRQTALLFERSLTTWHSPHVPPNQIKKLQQCVRLVYVAEVYYNMARAFHQLAIVHLAVPLYIKCINTLQHQSFEAWKQKVQHITLEADNERQFHNVKAVDYDAPQLRFCAMHNLALIYRSRGATALAAPLIAQSIVWTDDGL